MKHDQALKDHANNLYKEDIEKVENAHHFDEQRRGEEKPHRLVGNP